MYRIVSHNFQGRPDNTMYYLGWSEGWVSEPERATVLPQKVALDILENIPTWDGEVWQLEEV